MTSIYPKPSCPTAPAGYFFQQQLANEAAKKVTEKNLKPNLKEDCGFCLSPLGEQPEGDFNEGVMVTMTKCSHFFHEFCLNGLLNSEKAPNKDCPICRAPINKIDLTLYPVPSDSVTKTAQASTTAPSTAIQPPVAQPASKTVAPKPQVNQPKPAEGPGALSICTGTAVSLVKWAYKGLTTESVEATKGRIATTEKRLTKLETKWNNMSDSYKTEKNNMTQLIGTVRALMDNKPKDRSEAIKCSKEAEKRVEDLKKYYTAFDASLKDAQKEYKEKIEAVRKTLRESLTTFEKELDKVKQ